MKAIGGIAILILSAIAARPSFADSSDASSDKCVAVSTAKFMQWHQNSILLTRTNTFARGTTKVDQIIVTPNTAYGLHDGMWNSGNVTMQQRDAPSPQVLLTKMGLAECTDESKEQILGQPTTHYSYSYLPDRNGFAANGAMWISDATGLPVKEDLHEAAPPANRRVAVSVSTTYSYNDAVKIPPPAEHAEANRLDDAASALRRSQGGGQSSGVAGH